MAQPNIVGVNVCIYLCVYNSATSQIAGSDSEFGPC